MFVAEKGGRVWVVPAGSSQQSLLLDISDHVNNYGDRGLLDIAVDSDFASNHYLYLLYVYEPDPLMPSGAKVSRLTRVTVTSNSLGADPPETTIVGAAGGTPGMETCPAAANTVDCIPADATQHAIGTVRADADGTLWLGAGDATEVGVRDHAFNTYDPQSYLGKVLHVDRSGHGLPGHPFCPSDTDLTHVCTKVYAKGFRNPFRFTLRPGKGPAVGDVGQNSQEELDLLAPGRDYGWPCYEGNIHTAGYEDTDTCAQVYATEGTPSAKSPPAWSYPHNNSGAAIVAGPFYNGTAYPPDYAGQMFVGDYAAATIKRLDIDSSDQLTSVQGFATSWASGGVDLEIAPDGNLAYVDIGNLGAGDGEVREIVPTPGNNSPQAVASADETSGAHPLTVQFTGSASSDPDGDPLTYYWTFGDGSAASTAADPSHTYSADGPYIAKLTVTDSHGATSIAKVKIAVGNPPQVAVSAPTDGSKYVTGAFVELHGSATDPEDGTLSGTSLTWRVLLHHNDHLHDLGTFTGADSQFTTRVDHGADSYYEITLKATDSSRLATTKTVKIYPVTVNLAIDSTPEGAPISFGLSGATTPFSTLGAVGQLATVSAADTFSVDGESYRFVSWSDRGDRVHDIVVPASDRTMLAVYEPVPPPTPPPPPPPTTSPPPKSTSPLPSVPATPPSPADTTHIEISARKLRLGRHRTVKVRLRCVRPRHSCRGELVIRSDNAARARNGHPPRRVTYGRARFRIPAGTRRAVEVRLTRSAVRLLLRHGRLKIALATATYDLAGHRRRTTRTLLLERPR
jgi:glucose/arabinose dehydrogenase